MHSLSLLVLALPLVAALPGAAPAPGHVKRWTYTLGDDRARLSQDDVKWRLKQGWQESQIEHLDPNWTREKIQQLKATGDKGGQGPAEDSSSRPQRQADQERTGGEGVSPPPPTSNRFGDAEGGRHTGRRPQTAPSSVPPPPQQWEGSNEVDAEDGDSPASQQEEDEGIQNRFGVGGDLPDHQQRTGTGAGRPETTNTETPDAESGGGGATTNAGKAGSGAKTTSEQYQQEVVSRHNKARAEYGLSDEEKLQWHEGAAAAAGEWAEKCQRWHPDNKSLPPEKQFGQSIHSFAHNDTRVFGDGEAEHENDVRAFRFAFDDFKREETIYEWNIRNRDDLMARDGGQYYLKVGHFVNIVDKGYGGVACQSRFCSELKTESGAPLQDHIFVVCDYHMVKWYPNDDPRSVPHKP
ncbi:hypothetical protein CDD83_7444 [Cordyceps sp. RAO-2017]|nr:hypothetical protein CDD83_7444 [Cordyceps sp. RAO-2017]